MKPMFLRLFALVAVCLTVVRAAPVPATVHLEPRHADEPAPTSSVTTESSTTSRQVYNAPEQHEWPQDQAPSPSSAHPNNVDIKSGGYTTESQELQLRPLREELYRTMKKYGFLKVYGAMPIPDSMIGTVIPTRHAFLGIGPQIYSSLHDGPIPAADANRFTGDQAPSLSRRGDDHPDVKDHGKQENLIATSSAPTQDLDVTKLLQEGGRAQFSSDRSFEDAVRESKIPDAAALPDQRLGEPRGGSYQPFGQFVPPYGAIYDGHGGWSVLVPTTQGARRRLDLPYDHNPDPSDVTVAWPAEGAHKAGGKSVEVDIDAHIQKKPTSPFVDVQDQWSHGYDATRYGGQGGAFEHVHFSNTGDFRDVHSQPADPSGHGGFRQPTDEEIKHLQDFFAQQARIQQGEPHRGDDDGKGPSEEEIKRLQEYLAHAHAQQVEEQQRQEQQQQKEEHRHSRDGDDDDDKEKDKEAWVSEDKKPSSTHLHVDVDARVRAARQMQEQHPANFDTLKGIDLEAPRDEAKAQAAWLNQHGLNTTSDRLYFDSKLEQQTHSSSSSSSSSSSKQQETVEKPDAQGDKDGHAFHATVFNQATTSSSEETTRQLQQQQHQEQQQQQLLQQQQQQQEKENEKEKEKQAQAKA